MYYLYLLQNGYWHEHTKDERFDYIRNVVRGTAFDEVTCDFRIAGPEGVWSPSWPTGRLSLDRGAFFNVREENKRINDARDLIEFYADGLRGGEG